MFLICSNKANQSPNENKIIHLLSKNQKQILKLRGFNRKTKNDITPNSRKIRKIFRSKAVSFLEMQAKNKALLPKSYTIPKRNHIKIAIKRGREYGLKELKFYESNGSVKVKLKLLYDVR